VNQQLDFIDQRSLRPDDWKLQHHRRLRRRHTHHHGRARHNEDEADVQNAGVIVVKGIVMGGDAMHSAMSLGVPVNYCVVMVFILAAFVNVFRRGERDPPDRDGQSNPRQP
jgi:hypothetical protein